MARLPSAEALGPLPSMASGRPMAHIDESGRARGAAALAAGVEKLGAGIKSFGASMDAAQEANSAFEVTKANSQWSVAKLDAAAGLKGPGGSTGAGSMGGGYAAPGAVAPDADPFNPAAPADDTPDVGPQAAVAPQAGAAPGSQAPYAINQQGAVATAQPVQSATGNPNYDAQLADAIKKRDEVAATITDPRKQALWKLQTDDDIARIRIAATRQARAVDRDQHLAYARDNQDAIISRAIASDDEVARADAIHSQMQLIDGYAAKGYMTQQQAFAWKGAFRNKYAESFALASEAKGPEAVNRTISELEQARLNAGTAPQKQEKTLGPRSDLAPSKPLEIAKTLLGKHEVQHRDTIAQFIGKVGGSNVDPAVTPWCAGFVNGVLRASGTGGTDSLAARSFLNYGTPTNKPSEGDIVVLSRGSNPNLGHVGFYVGEGSKPGTIKVLGGNQSDSVSEQEFSTARVLGFRQVAPGDVGKPLPEGVAGAAPGQPYKVASVGGGYELQNPVHRYNPGEPSQYEAQNPVDRYDPSQPRTDYEAQPLDQRTQGGDQVALAGDQPAQPVQVAQAQPERKPTIYDAMDPLKREEVLKKLRGVREHFDVLAEKERKLKEDEYLKEAFSRASKGQLTGDYIETIRPYIGHTEYKGLLKTMGGDDAVDDPSAIVELTTKVDELSPPEYQKIATSYLNQNKLKTSTYITFSEKNRSANKDDAPASPFKSGRDFVKSNLDTAPFTDPTGVITAQVKAALSQGLSEYDIWAEGNPRATREDAMKKANEIVKLTRPLDINLRLTTPLSRYFGNKTRSEVNIEDVDTAEQALANEIRGGSVTNKADIDLQIRRLQTWRELISRSQTGQPGGR